MQHVAIESLGWVPKSPVLMSSLNRAHAYASQQQHRQLTLDHLLLALTEDSDALVVLHAGNVDIDKLRSAISDLVGRDDDRAILPDLAGPAASSELVTIFEYASAAADQSGRTTIDGAIILAALIGEGNSAAARLLETHGLTFDHAITSLQNMVASENSEPVTEATEDIDAFDKAENIPVSDHARLATSSAPSFPPVIPVVKKTVSDSSRLVTPSAPSIPPIAPQNPQTPVAAAPPEPESPFSDIPPSFGGGGEPQSSPVAPPQSPPVAPPQVAPPAPPQAAPPPAPAPTAAPGPGPRTARRGINENTGSAGPVPQPERRIGAGERIGASYQGPAHETPMPGPGAPSQDGMIAPWPDPESAAPPPPPPGQMPPHAQPHPSQQVRRRATNIGGTRGGPVPVNGAVPPTQTSTAQGTPLSPMVGEGQLIENIPRKMRVGIPEQIEVRIARNSVTAPTNNMQGRGAPQSHDVYVTKAMTVRLRAPEGGVRIETSSPETQWIDNALGLIHDDFASWRWTVTPEIRGTTKLQLVVSARTVGADGVAAETALPDQIFDVVIRMNYVRTAKRLGGWAAAAAAGGVITAFGADAYTRVLALVDLL